jgi:hypothetical protein
MRRGSFEDPVEIRGACACSANDEDVYLSRRTRTAGLIFGYTVAVLMALIAVMFVLASGNGWVCGRTASPVCVHGSGD